MGTAGTSYAGEAFPDSKYYDVYKATSGTTISALTACNGGVCGVCYGHGLSETNKWYNDNASFVSASNPWMYRGGYSGNGINAGVFEFYYNTGAAAAGYGFRSTMAG